MHLAGQIKAAGLTTTQLSEAIADRLTRDSVRPDVNVQIVQVGSGKIYVSGEVRRPGACPLTRPMTVLEAIIAAGGPADFAKTRRIYILRGTNKLPFNYIDVSKGLHPEQNILLQNGDIIVVP